MSEGAKWTDEHGREIANPNSVLILDHFPGLGTGEQAVGATKLDARNEDQLRTALGKPLNYSLYDGLLSDAQAALFEENYVEAVLHLAIACEVASKRAFFPAGTTAAAVDALTARRELSLPVEELIDKVALSVFGESFKNQDPADSKKIKALVNARNHAAHTARAQYTDDAAGQTRIRGQGHFVSLVVCGHAANFLAG